MSVPAVCLVVLDGWGLAEPGPGNAIELADTPVFDELWEKHPHTTLVTHGPAVGLPEGQMGNSEVGHLNLGAGAVVKQDLLRIDEAIEDGSFYENEALSAPARRRAAAPARPRLGRRRPLEHGAPEGAGGAGRAARASRTWWSTRSPTAATRARQRRAAMWPR